MELQLDPNKTYAIALEGGGGKGSYEAGVWRALEEAGIRYNAVSGCSVGALNGAMMAMRDLPRALEIWSNIRMTDVLNVDEEKADAAVRLMNGEFRMEDVWSLLQTAPDLIRSRGLDAAPLRAWMKKILDPAAIKASDVQLYVTTVDLKELRGLEIHVNELPEDQVIDMLLASAFHPAFRQEKLGGRYYADGGFFDGIPIHALIENGYKDIIAVRMPGMSVVRPVEIPDSVTVHWLLTKDNLGSMLNFDASQARRNIRTGYTNAMRFLYGLTGREFAVERTLSDRQALDRLLDFLTEGKEPGELRRAVVKGLPRIAQAVGSSSGDSVYQIWLSFLEKEAVEAGVDPFRLYTDVELAAALREKMEPSAAYEELGLAAPGAVPEKTAGEGAEKQPPSPKDAAGRDVPREEPRKEDAPKLILASASPRRRELLRMAGIEFEVCPADIDETVPEDVPPLARAEYLARAKAAALAERFPDRTVLGADTAVICRGQVLGKPRSEEEAAAFLRFLSGKTHVVCTGVALAKGKETESFSSAAEVSFYELSEKEIAEYVASGEPMDKAGAYAVQGKGFRFVRRIVGDYYTVVGLPLAETVRRLEQMAGEDR